MARNFIKELLVKFKGDTRSFDSAVENSKKKLNNFGGEVDRASKRVNSAFGKMGESIKLVAGSYAVLNVIRWADDMKLLEARIKSITSETGDFNAVMRRLSETAAATGTELGTTVDVFQRISFSKKEIGATNDELLLFTDSVQKLGVMSGAGTESLKFGLLQLGQGLSAGTLRAEEFNSILENIPAVGKAIADGLGVSVGQLRNMVLDGKVASKDVFQALLGQTSLINSQFEKFPKTAGQAFQGAFTQLKTLIASLDSMLGVTSAIASALDFGSRRLMEMRATAIYLGEVFKAFKFIVLDIMNDIEVSVANVNNRIIASLEKLTRQDMSKLYNTTTVDKHYENQIAKLKTLDQVNREVFGEKSSERMTSYQSQVGQISKSIDALGKASTASAEKNKTVERSIRSVGLQADDTKEKLVDMVMSASQGFEGFKSVALNAFDQVLRGMLKISLGGDVGGTLGGILGGGLGGGFGAAGGHFKSSASASLFGTMKGIKWDTPAFATGGRVRVGGTGGTDSQLVSFRATPNETITVEKPGQNLGGGASGGTMVVNQTINLSTGVQQTVAAEIRRFLPQFKQIAVESVDMAYKRRQVQFS